MRSFCIGIKATNLNPGPDTRIVELALVETENHVPTGRVIHEFFDPGKDVSPEAASVHGLSRGMLAGKPRFHQAAARISAFVGDARLWTPRPGFVGSVLGTESGLCPPEIPLSWNVEDSFPFLNTRIPLNGRNFGEAVRYLGITPPGIPWRTAMSEAAGLCAVMARASGAPDVPIRRMMLAGNEARVAREGMEDFRRAPEAVSPSDASMSAPQPPQARDVPPPPPTPSHPRDDEHRKMIGMALKAAIERASDFRDFVGRAMTERLSVRPSLTTRGDLSGMAWRFRETVIETEDIGLPVSFFSSGPLAFSRARDAHFLEELRDAYDDFHMPPSVREGIIRSGERVVRPDAAARGPETSPAFAEAISRINDMPASVDTRNDIYATLPGGRDPWSSVPRSEIVARAASVISDVKTLRDGFSAAPDDKRMSAYRWICRGLSPEHALCMLAVRGEKYKTGMPPGVMDAAKIVARAARGPDADATRPPPRNDAPKSKARDGGTSVEMRNETGNAEIDAEIRRVNDLPPSMERGFYSGIRMGEHRDEWSRAPRNAIMETSDRRAAGSRPVAEAISSLDDKEGLGLRRWICRGLDPDHAICMTTQIMRLRKKPLPKPVEDVAERLESGEIVGPFPS